MRKVNGAMEHRFNPIHFTLSLPLDCSDPDEIEWEDPRNIQRESCGADTQKAQPVAGVLPQALPQADLLRR